jgi:(1->4)-alpha-D-glucan 1-alpha-D-glucosylmutase
LNHRGAQAELRATYRLQLTAQFGFAAATSLIPYLRDLGISHLYLSPLLQARPASAHGYDVTDPRRISRALGGEGAFRRLADAARGAGMGVIADVVPNHMAADDGNRYWSDPSARARFFDVDPLTGKHRRFFDFDDLAGVRQEDPAVFAETHELVLGLVRDGVLDGLRIDHVDGLADPGGYLSRLRDCGLERVWVEKILDPGERLRDWPVCGTVGYEFLNDVCALFVAPQGEAELTTLWQTISGERRRFAEIAFEAKLEQVQSRFGLEVDRLVRLGPSLKRESIEHALASVPVYRTYVDPARETVSDEDRAVILGAQLDPHLQRILLLEEPAPREFLIRFQQTTPAVMAKGVEDTAFYRYSRLLALNEVGGDPSRFGIDVERFHAGNAERAVRFPATLLSTQTHDAKRSADVRARIATLASIPDAWSRHVERWLELTEPLRDGDAPDASERYLLFQTLVGAWPIELRRVESYLVKALREAKRNTGWIAHNDEWEAAAVQFCRRLYGEPRFWREFEPFAATAAAGGDRIALAQLVLKLTAPGIPDIYQGDELTYLVLVDPDNRRPVDWGWRQAMLSRLMGGTRPVGELRKLFLITRLLGLRARRPEPFRGGYEPLAAGEHGCAFLRGGDVLVAVAVPAGRAEGVLEAPHGRWRDVLRGEERSFNGRTPLSDVVGDVGLGVFERTYSP